MAESKIYRNRYGNQYKYVQIGPCKFEFVIWGVNYMRSGVDEDGAISFFDPEGGPFIHVGDTIPGTNHKIVAINFADGQTFLWTEDAGS